MSRSIVMLIGTVVVATLGCTTGDEQTSTAAEPIDQSAPSSEPTESLATITSTLDLPPRPGDPPNVTEGIPHIQLDQNASDDMISELAAWAFSLDAVNERPSRASLPGARALVVAPDVPLNSNAVIVDREFGHIHAPPNGGGSLHIRLPQKAAQEAVGAGWGEYHPFALDGTMPDLIMVYAPRNQQDLVYVQSIIEAAVAFATSE